MNEKLATCLTMLALVPIWVDYLQHTSPAPGASS